MQVNDRLLAQVICDVTDERFDPRIYTVYEITSNKNRKYYVRCLLQGFHQQMYYLFLIFAQNCKNGLTIQITVLSLLRWVLGLLGAYVLLQYRQSNICGYPYNNSGTQGKLTVHFPPPFHKLCRFFARSILKGKARHEIKRRCSSLEWGVLSSFQVKTSRWEGEFVVLEVEWH
jgi:hypothetical protein